MAGTRAVNRGDGVIRRLAAPGVVAAVAVGASTLVGVVDPNLPGRYPTCPFLLLTGWYCPGCGSLRAVHALVHLDVGTAVDRSPLLVAVLPFMALAWLAWVRRAVTGRPPRRVLPASVVYLLGAAVVAYWLLRNLPATAWLAP